MEARLTRKHDADDNYGEGKERERPHRLVAADTRRDNNRYDNYTENESVSQTVQGQREPFPHAPNATRIVAG
jgi:hypothetical protein